MKVSPIELDVDRVLLSLVPPFKNGESGCAAPCRHSAGIG